MDEKEYNGLFDKFQTYATYLGGLPMNRDHVASDYVAAARVVLDNDVPIGNVEWDEFAESLKVHLRKSDLKKKEELKKYVNPTIAETMDLLKRGLKPYFYDHYSHNLVELTMENQHNVSSTLDVEWLHEKIAKKIQDRYFEMGKLKEEKQKAIEDYDAKIKELEERIQKIEETGTDLIL